MELPRFDAASLADESNTTYHQKIKAHTEQLEQLLATSTQIDWTAALNNTDPAVDSISFLAYLSFYGAMVQNQNLAPQAFQDYATHVVRLLVSFDPRQVRYGGTAFMNLCMQLLTAQLVPSSVAIKTVSMALRRLDPSGCVLTAAHVALIDLAVRTGDVQDPEFVAVINKPILFVPGIPNQVPKGTVPADMSLPSLYFMTDKTGLVPQPLPTDVLRYEYLCGTAQVMRRDWAKAYANFERCVSYPASDGQTWLLVVLARKRLLLVALLHRGDSQKLLQSAAANVRRSYAHLTATYQDFASCYQTDDGVALAAMARDHHATWDMDQNTGLVAECLAAHTYKKVRVLNKLYSKMFIAELREAVATKYTGAPGPLDTDEQAEELVQSMIDSGRVDAQLGTHTDGRRFAEFVPARSRGRPGKEEQEKEDKMRQAEHDLAELKQQWELFESRIATSKDAVTLRANELRRSRVVIDNPNAKFSDFGGGGLDLGEGMLDPWLPHDTIDEDLMVG